MNENSTDIRIIAIIKNNPGIFYKKLRTEYLKNIPRRTLYSRLNRLIQLKLIVKKPYIMDIRQVRFWVLE